MKWKKMMSLLLVAVLIGSLFAAFGSSLASAEGEYVDEIRLEVRMEQSVGVGDAATGVIDAFLQAVDGPTYDGIDDEWKANLIPLESFGSYTEFSYNTAWTEDSGFEVDTTGDGDLQVNPFAMREIRFATNFIVSRQEYVEELYDGFSIPMYQAISPSNPSYDAELRQIDEKYGLTYAGDFERGYNMIQDAMTDAMNNPDIAGEIRTPEDSPTNYWQYKAPGGAWEDIEVHMLIRVEDTRQEIGLNLADLLEDCHIKAERDVQDRDAIDIWLFTDPADMEWSLYTGGWISSATVAYQHATPVQFYTDYYPYMPGGIFGETNRYYHLRDEPYAQELLEDWANPLMAGQISDEETYWEYVRHISDVGVYQGARVFLENSADIVPLNDEAVVEVAADAVTGWSQIFSPRTLKTQDGTFTAAQFSAAGVLYMDNFNNIDGSSDYYGILQQRICFDPGTTLDPSKGTSIPVRADFVDDNGEYMLDMDYHFDNDGNLVKELPIPDNDNVWFYDVQAEEWINGGHEYVPIMEGDPPVQTGADLTEVDTVATAVTYDYHLGKWHSGHDLTTRDILAWHAFSMQLSYGPEWGAVGDQYYHVGYGTQNRPYYQNVKAIEVIDAEEGILKFYGDYTFPAESEMAGYYGTFPQHPWQMYEAVSHLRGQTELASTDTVYEWSNIPGAEYVHWISSSQTVDYSDTLANIADDGWIPPYLQSGPTPITVGELENEIDAIRGFQDQYELSFISQGPFIFVRYDTANLVVEMERHPYPDYPLPDDYWRDKLYVAGMRHGTMTAPTEVVAGEALEADVRVRVFEQYPLRRTRNLDPAVDDYEAEVTIYDEFDTVVDTFEPDYVNTDGSYLAVTLPGSFTTDLEEGFYTIEFQSKLVDEVATSVSSASFWLAEESAGGLINHELEIEPTSGYAPLEVDITVSAENTGGEELSETITLDGADTGYTLNVSAGETAEETFTHTLDEVGEYTFEFGPVSREVSVVEKPPVPAELEDFELSITPTTGDAPLDVEISLSVTNTGEEDTEAVLYRGTEAYETFDVSPGDFETTINKTLDAGVHVFYWGEESVLVNAREDVVPGEPELVNLDLGVEPTSGEEPLEVTISVSAENTGDADGEVDVIIDGSIEYTLTVPAGETADHEFTYEFENHGNYDVEFGDLTETVEVEEETPGFMFLLLAVSAVFAVVIYHVKKR
ncbi:MAG: hypothetical protein R6U17_05595 [Thermoplasmata archaeon]